jgi:hypothetical protein
MTGSFPVAFHPCCSASVWSDILTSSPWFVTAFWDRTRRALASQRAFQDAETLRKAVLEEWDSSRRWILIDALLSIADPGDAHRPLPGWVSDIFGSSAYLEQEYVTKKLEERRNEIEKEAVELDRKRYAQD